MAKYVTLDALEMSDDVRALNPQLAQKPMKEPKTDARKDLEREIRENFARQFEAIWQRNGGPELIKEFKFCEERGWKADYVYKTNNYKWVIELDGGVYTGGRHSRGGPSYVEDCIKLNTAAMLHYYVIRIPTGCATDFYLSKIIQAITN